MTNKKTYPYVGEIKYCSTTNRLFSYDGFNWNQINQFDFSFFGELLYLGRHLTLDECDILSRIERNLKIYNSVKCNLKKDIIRIIEPIILIEKRKLNITKILKKNVSV